MCVCPLYVFRLVRLVNVIHMFSLLARYGHNKNIFYVFFFFLFDWHTHTLTHTHCF